MNIPSWRKCAYFSLFLVWIATVVAWGYFTASVHHLSQLCVGLLAFIVTAGVCLFVLPTGVVAYLCVLRQKSRARRAAGAGHVQAEERYHQLDEAEDDSVPSTRQPSSTGACKPRSWRCAGRWTLIVLGVLLVLLLVASVWTTFGVLIYLDRNSLPQLDGKLHLAGLDSSVEVIREPSGVVHIEADTEHDLYFAQGVASAQSRLWQMDFQRRVARGSLSAMVGRAAHKIDVFMRTLGLYRVAQANARNLPDEALEVVQAYVDGVNAYIDSQNPTTFEYFIFGASPAKFTVADVLGWSKVMALSLSLNMDKELMRFHYLKDQSLGLDRIAQLMPLYDSKHFPTVLSKEDVLPPIDSSEPAADPFASAGVPIQQWLEKVKGLQAPVMSTVPGWKHFKDIMGLLGTSARESNNWVVHGNRTTTGLPLLCNDPHLDLFAPSIWLLFHLKGPNSNAIGASFAGVPGIVLGHNHNAGGSISWGITNTGADVQDTHAMTDKPGDSTHYLLDGEYVPYDIRTEVINVHGGEDIKLRVRESVWGPVITEAVPDRDKDTNGLYEGHIPLSLRWTSLNTTDNTVYAFILMNRAKNWHEFREATRYFLGPVSNLIYADSAGNIGYTMPGVVPRRSANHTGLYPVPGDTSDYAWSGYIPWDEMPHAFNPEVGYIASANNQVTPNGWPERNRIALDWDAGPFGFRARRIVEMLNAKDKLSPMDMRAMQQDYQSGIARDFKSVIARLDDDVLSSHSARQWRDRLLRWDTVASVGNKDTSVLHHWYRNLVHEFEAELGVKYYSNTGFMLSVFNGTQTDPVCGLPEDCLRVSGAAFKRAVDSHESTKWGEGSCHRALFKHKVLGASPLACLANRYVDKGGDMSSVNVGGFSYNDGDFTMTHGPSYRQVVSFSDIEGTKGESVFMNPLGQSGNMLSKHYDDQLKPWAEGEYLGMMMRQFKHAHKLKLN